MKTIAIPTLNAVNGGTPVPGDWNKYSAELLREIRPVEGLPPWAKLFAIPVDGPSLKKLGIHSGDFLIVHKTTRYDEGKIGIWDTPHGRTAKYAFMNSDGSVTLHNKNGWERRYASEELMLFGVAVRVERDLA